MELRYMGFEQVQNARGYRFDVIVKGEATREVVITVDLSLFLTHRIGIQEGPSLSAQKLAADLENCLDGSHNLTTEDMRAYADRRAAAEARKIESRSGSRRPKMPVSNSESAWRGQYR